MSSTFRPFIEKLGGSPAESFIGNRGELFYDPETTTLRVSDGVTVGGIEIVGGSTITAETQSGRSANIFVDNASLAVIDTEIINSIPDAKCYLLNSAEITDEKATLITSNAGENYYLYAYDGEYDDNFPYAAELIVKLTKEEAAICSLSPYFTTPSGSIIDQASKNYAFLTADRRELDKLRAAVAAYYLGQQYDNATVLDKQAYWQNALNAAISGSIVSTWKVLTDMVTATSSGTNILEAFLNDAYPSGSYTPPGGGAIESPTYARYMYWNNSVLNGNFAQPMLIGRYNGSAVGISGGNKHYIIFNLAQNWAQFTTDYTTLSLIGPSGTYTWNLADAEKQAGDQHYYIEMDKSAQIADDAAARVLTEELLSETYSSSSQLWTIRVENAPAASNEDDAVLELVMQNIGGHIIKYPRYGVANPPTPSTFTKTFEF